jgi:hypothetical protein
MQRYIAASMQILQRLNIVEIQQLEARQWMKDTENKIENILEKIEENSPKMLPEQIFPIPKSNSFNFLTATTTDSSSSTIKSISSVPA